MVLESILETTKSSFMKINKTKKINLFFQLVAGMLLIIIYSAMIVLFNAAIIWLFPELYSYSDFMFRIEILLLVSISFYKIILITYRLFNDTFKLGI